MTTATKQQKLERYGAAIERLKASLTADPDHAVEALLMARASITAALNNAQAASDPEMVALRRLRAVRRRVHGRVPALKAKVEQLLRLAEIDAQGPDPEVAIYQLERAARALDVFVRLTPLLVSGPGA